MKATLRGLALMLCAAMPLASLAAAPLPLAAFFKKADTTGAALSPNGRFAAVRKLSPQGRAMLVAYDVMARQSKAIANFTNADIDTFHWLSDQRLVFTLINVDHGGEAGSTGLYAIDRDGKDLISLAPTIARKRSFAESDVVNYRQREQAVYQGFPQAKDAAMMVVEDTDGERTLKRLSTRTGSRSALKIPFGAIHGLIDAEGEVRTATVARKDRIITYFLDKEGWREIDNRDEKSEARFEPLLYADKQLYVRARNGNDEAGIYRYDLAKNAIAPQALISAPGFDTDGEFIVSDSKMLGFRFTTDADVTVWFDPAMKALQQEVDLLRPGLVNNLSRGRSSETPYVLIDSWSDIQNHAYILYNTETKEQGLLGQATPGLDAGQMSPMEMVRYPARDGARIPAFLTLPQGAAKTRLPTVVLAGDQAGFRSGDWQWSAAVQFLASRGYAVLQPEPRGVRGFGRAHFLGGHAGRHDIADAVKWAVAAGHTDPARVCIAGTGYGGYAAMMALLRDADTFKCGLSWSGLTAYQDNPDDGRLKEIKQPLLLAYGTDDETVKYAQALAFYKALKAGNPQAEWLEYTSSVDDWKTQKNRIDLWQHIESFLAKQIGPQ